MRRARTLEELVHTVTDSLTVISSHAQYLAGRPDLSATFRDGLATILDETERIGGHLAMIPPRLGVQRLWQTPGEGEAGEVGK